MRKLGFFILLLLLATPLTCKAVEQPPCSENMENAGNKNQFVLVACPRGHLGLQLNKYWNAVKNSDLKHKAITEAPPHCKLTTFFSSKLKAPGFKKALRNTLNYLKNRKIPRDIQVERLVQGRPKDPLDYIRIKSDFLHEFASEFAENQNLPKSIAAKKKLPLHIKLRNHIFTKPERLLKIQKLENNLNLHGNAKWTVAIFRKVGEKLIPVVSCPVR